MYRQKRIPEKYRPRPKQSLNVFSGAFPELEHDIMNSASLRRKGREDQGKHHQIQTDQSTIFLCDEDPVLFQEQKVPAEEEQVLSASLLLQFKFRHAGCCPQLK